MSNVFEASEQGRLALRKTIGHLSGGTIVKIVGEQASMVDTTRLFVVEAHGFKEWVPEHDLIVRRPRTH